MALAPATWRTIPSDIRHLDLENLPSEMTDIVEKATGSQNAEDGGDAAMDFIFDVPIDVAYRLTGFRHDRADVDGAVQAPIP